jgi:hypothetical protein
LGNSYLFRSIRGAFVALFGSSVPNDEDFLPFFRDRGCWLLHLPPDLRRRRGRPSKKKAPPDVAYLVSAIKDAHPQFIVGTREPIRRPLSDAVDMLGIPADRLLCARMPRELRTANFANRLGRWLSSDAQEPSIQAVEHSLPVTK